MMSEDYIKKIKDEFNAENYEHAESCVQNLVTLEILKNATSSNIIKVVQTLVDILKSHKIVKETKIEAQKFISCVYDVLSVIPVFFTDFHSNKKIDKRDFENTLKEYAKQIEMIGNHTLENLLNIDGDKNNENKNLLTLRILFFLYNNYVYFVSNIEKFKQNQIEMMIRKYFIKKLDLIISLFINSSNTDAFLIFIYLLKQISSEIEINMNVDKINFILIRGIGGIKKTNGFYYFSQTWFPVKDYFCVLANYFWNTKFSEKSNSKSHFLYSLIDGKFVDTCEYLSIYGNDEEIKELFGMVLAVCEENDKLNKDNKAYKFFVKEIPSLKETKHYEKLEMLLKRIVSYNFFKELRNTTKDTKITLKCLRDYYKDIFEEKQLCRNINLAMTHLIIRAYKESFDASVAKQDNKVDLKSRFKELFNNNMFNQLSLNSDELIQYYGNLLKNQNQNSNNKNEIESVLYTTSIYQILDLIVALSDFEIINTEFLNGLFEYTLNELLSNLITKNPCYDLISNIINFLYTCYLLYLNNESKEQLRNIFQNQKTYTEVRLLEMIKCLKSVKGMDVFTILLFRELLIELIDVQVNKKGITLQCLDVEEMKFKHFAKPDKNEPYMLDFLIPENDISSILTIDVIKKSFNDANSDHLLLFFVRDKDLLKWFKKKLENKNEEQMVLDMIYDLLFHIGTNSNSNVSTKDIKVYKNFLKKLINRTDFEIETVKEIVQNEFTEAHKLPCAIL